MQQRSAAVRQLQLTRTARVAGEAFAFLEPDTPHAPARRLPGGLAWMFLGIAAAAGLYLGL